jgi:hypothetical protein
MFYNFCTSNAICKHKARINYTTKRRKVSFSSTSTPSTKLAAIMIFIHELNIKITLIINITVKFCQIRRAGYAALIEQMKNRIVAKLGSN